MLKQRMYYPTGIPPPKLPSKILESVSRSHQSFPGRLRPKKSKNADHRVGICAYQISPTLWCGILSWKFLLTSR